MAKYIINKTDEGKYYFILKDDNGNAILRGYNLDSVALCNKEIKITKICSRDITNFSIDYEQCIFLLHSQSGKLIARTFLLHHTKDSLDNAVLAVIKNAPTATIETDYKYESKEQQVVFAKHPMTGKKIINKHIAMLELQVLQLKMETLLQTEIAKNNKDAYDKTNKELFDMTMRHEELEDRYDLVVIEKESLKVEKDFIKKTLDRAVFRQIEINDELKKTKIDNLKLVDQYNKIPKLIRSIFS